MKVATLKYKICTAVSKGMKGCATLHDRVELWEGEGRLQRTCSVSEFATLQFGTFTVLKAGGKMLL